MKSCIHKGKVLDFRYTKHTQDSCVLHIGDITVGIIHKISGTWSAHGWGIDHPSATHAPLVNGFSSRYYASEYLLKALGYWRS